MPGIPTPSNFVNPNLQAASQAAYAARAAGFTGNALVTIVAIGGPESGWVPTKHNPVPPDDSYGVWQINMIGSMGPARRKQFGITSNEQLYDPMVNARAAWIVSNHGTNFAPWSTFKDGKYKASIPLAKQAITVAAPPGSTKFGVPPVQPGGPSLPGFLDPIGKAVASLNAQLQKIGSNAAIVLLIILFLAIGIMLITRTSVGKVVADVTPIGGAIKTVSNAVATRSYKGRHE